MTLVIQVTFRTGLRLTRGSRRALGYESGASVAGSPGVGGPLGTQEGTRGATDPVGGRLGCDVGHAEQARFWVDDQG
jgi:hypothetical protein